MAKARPRIGQDDERSGSLLVILFYPTWPLITLGIVFALTEVAEQREMLQAVGHNAATVYAKSSDTQRRLHNRFWFNNLEIEDTEITGQELPPLSPRAIGASSARALATRLGTSFWLKNEQSALSRALMSSLVR